LIASTVSCACAKKEILTSKKKKYVFIGNKF
jgi:hypothetical protein